MEPPINVFWDFLKNLKDLVVSVKIESAKACHNGNVLVQLSNSEFKVQDKEGNVGICKLVEKQTSELKDNEMSISFKMDDSETYLVSKISGKKATLSAPSATGSNVYDGLTVPWNFATSTSDGAAQVEEAGDDNTLTGSDDTDFTDDA